LDSFIAKQNAEISKKAFGITTNINAGTGIKKMRILTKMFLIRQVSGNILALVQACR
jgi:hypothetical protein